jgi:hypothetical protein
VRTIVSAIEANGLVVRARMNRLLKDRGVRFVVVSGSRLGWPHASAMLEVQGSVDLSGNVNQVKLCCSATNDDPYGAVRVAPTVRDAVVELDELPGLIRLILRERDAVIDMMARGERGPINGLHFTWISPGPDWSFGHGQQ